MATLKASLPILLLLSGSLLSCSGNSQEDRPASRDEDTYPLSGEVVRIDSVNNRLTVAHDEIPHFMDAMTMSFTIRDETIFGNVSVGDRITATLVISHEQSWLEDVQVGNPGDRTVSASGDAAVLQPFTTGDKLPDLKFVNHQNLTFSFASLTGKAVALTFIYTGCPLPDFCILMSKNFANVQTLMKQQPELGDSWHLVSVSFDPENDTPQVLDRYGRQYEADFMHWDFVTSDIETIQMLAKRFDLYLSAGNSGRIDHTLRTVLLDKEGKIRKVIKGNSWAPHDLAGELSLLARE